MGFFHELEQLLFQNMIGPEVLTKTMCLFQQTLSSSLSLFLFIYFYFILGGVGIGFVFGSYYLLFYKVGKGKAGRHNLKNLFLKSIWINIMRVNQVT